MASTIPALRGRFGSFEYWLTTMHVGELVRNITIPNDLPGWKEMSLEEQYQRDINLLRVKRDIAPYFANDEDRFSGALILAVLNNEGMQFEPLESVGNINKLPNLYKASAENIGFITLTGGEMFVPLDGQHRAKALKYATSGTDDNNVPIEGIRANTSLSNEDVAVILVRFDQDGSRRIFNKVNRYAKPTTRGQNLITDDDDQVAVLTRKMVNEAGMLPARLVRHQSNTLSAKASEFTTLSTLYDANMAIIKARFPVPSKPETANDEQADCFYDEVVRVWDLLINHVDLFAQALSDVSENGDQVRRNVRAETLLGKPVAQLSLVRAFLLLFEHCDGVSEQEVCERLNELDWLQGNELWTGVLMHPNGRIMSGRRTVNTAAKFVAYLCGMKLDSSEQEELVEQIAGEQDYVLPPPIA